MNRSLPLKRPYGFFAAGPEMLRALDLLSDGAFKVFVYCALKASRHTGQCVTSPQELARATGKSRRSITTYLEELARKKVCRLEPGRNQHHSGVIEIEDAFWPYEKAHRTERSQAEAEYVECVKRSFLAHPIVRSSFGAADRRLARDLYDQGTPFQQVERALLLGLARKYTSWLNLKRGLAITSLHYFLPVLEEVQHTQVSDGYWTYLKLRLDHYRKQWLEQQQAQATSSPANLSSGITGTEYARAGKE